MTPTNRRPEYRAGIRENNEGSASETCCQKVSEGDGERREVHTLEDVLVAVENLSTKIKDVCDLQQQAIRSLQGLDLETGEEIFGKEE